jgi:ribosomal protein L23
MSVNTISTPAKKRRVRGHAGMTSRLKKAVVSFRPGDVIDEKA